MAQARRRRQRATAGRRPCDAPIVEAYGAFVDHLRVSATVCAAHWLLDAFMDVLCCSVVMGVYVSVSVRVRCGIGSGFGWYCRVRLVQSSVSA